MAQRIYLPPALNKGNDDTSAALRRRLNEQKQRAVEANQMAEIRVNTAEMEAEAAKHERNQRAFERDEFPEAKTVVTASTPNPEGDGGGRRFNVDDDGNLHPDKEGNFVFQEALEYSRLLRREKQDNTNIALTLRYFNVDGEGHIHADPAGSFTFNEALAFSREIKADTDTQRYNVDDAGNIFPDANGGFIFEEAMRLRGEIREERRRMEEDRRKAERDGGGKEYVIIKPDGSHEVKKADEPIIIRQASPSVNLFELRDKDGNPYRLTREQVLTQIDFWKAQDGMKQDEERHKKQMDLLDTVTDNIGPGIKAVREGIGKLRKETGGKRPVKCEECGNMSYVDAGAETFFCQHCNEEMEVARRETS